jgi:hypothetical protein
MELCIVEAVAVTRALLPWRGSCRSAACSVALESGRLVGIGLRIYCLGLSCDLYT